MCLYIQAICAYVCTCIYISTGDASLTTIRLSVNCGQDGIEILIPKHNTVTLLWLTASADIILHYLYAIVRLYKRIYIYIYTIGYITIAFVCKTVVYYNYLYTKHMHCSTHSTLYINLNQHHY